MIFIYTATGEAIRNVGESSSVMEWESGEVSRVDSDGGDTIMEWGEVELQLEGPVVERYTATAEISKHHREVGADFADNTGKNPTEFTLECFIPYEPTLPGIDSDDRVNVVMDTLESLRGTGQTVDVDTGTRFYTGYALISFEDTRDEPVDALSLSLTFHQANTVQTAIVNVPAPRTERTRAVTNGGRNTPQNAGNAGANAAPVANRDNHDQAQTAARNLTNALGITR